MDLLYKKNNNLKPPNISVHGHKCLTCQAVPLVDSKEAVGGDCDYGRWCQTRLGVGRYMRHRRVRWELQHHDNILLHLLRKHQRGLQKKILFRTPRMDNGMQGREEKNQDMERRTKSKIKRWGKQPQSVLARKNEREMEKREGKKES